MMIPPAGIPAYILYGKFYLCFVRGIRIIEEGDPQVSRTGQ